MAKYKVLKVERDDAVARALEAERLSRVEEVRRLESELAEVRRVLEIERAQRVYLENFLASVKNAAHQVTTLLERS
jgi:hypothetical protein